MARPRRQVVFAGPLPPPVTGQTLAGQGVVSALAAQQPELSITTLPTQRGAGGSVPGASSLARLARTLLATARLVAIGPTTLLLSLERGPGQYLQTVLVLAAALRGRLDRLIVLHHSWDGVALVGPIRAVAGRGRFRVEHVALCAGHAEHVAAHNPASMVDRIWEVSNAGWMAVESPPIGLEPSRSDRRDEGPLVILMLSNLIPDKGVDTFVGLARAFRGHPDFEFRLAGPCPDREVARRIEAAQQAGDLTYVGSVPATERRGAVAKAGLLVLPTRYRTETEPLVVLEALACGVPVLTTGRGCLSERLPTDWIVDEGDVDAWVDAVKRMAGQARRSRGVAAERWETVSQSGVAALAELARSLADERR